MDDGHPVVVRRLPLEVVEVPTVEILAGNSVVIPPLSESYLLQSGHCGPGGLIEGRPDADMAEGLMVGRTVIDTQAMDLFAVMTNVTHQPTTLR